MYSVFVFNKHILLEILVLSYEITYFALSILTDQQEEKDRIRPRRSHHHYQIHKTTNFVGESVSEAELIFFCERQASKAKTMELNGNGRICKGH